MRLLVSLAPQTVDFQRGRRDARVQLGGVRIWIRRHTCDIQEFRSLCVQQARGPDCGLPAQAIGPVGFLFGAPVTLGVIGAPGIWLGPAGQTSRP